MKECKYCGRENAEDAAYCCECGTGDFVISSATTSENDLAISPAEPVPEPPTETYWTPGYAWLFSLGIFLLVCGVTFLGSEFSRSSPKFHRTIRAWLPLVDQILIFGPLIIFSGIRNVKEFRERFAVIPISQQQLVMTFGLGILLQLANIGLVHNGLRSITPRTSFDPIIIALVVAPFVEEAFMRGYLYPCFRMRFSVASSIVQTVVIALVFHSQYWTSLRGLVFVGVLNIVLCVLRERTNSLWPPILCHLGCDLIVAAAVSATPFYR